MNYKGSIVIIDDDMDDQEMYHDAFAKIGTTNAIIPFYDAESALAYLRNTSDHPFLIISDIRLPRMNGFELKKILLEDPILGSNGIPFIFFTSSENKKTVKDAFSVAVQGFFVKKTSIDELQRTLQYILNYWGESFTPNSA